MKIMRLDNRNISDMEYLSERGFENIPFDEKDLGELKLKLRTKTISLNSGYYFGFISLITGAFLGVSLFFAFYNFHEPVKNSSARLSQKPEKEHSFMEQTIVLDTVKIENENFVRDKTEKTSTHISLSHKDSAEPETPLALASLPAPALSFNENEHKGLKYSPNSSVTYVHDLKVSDYHVLYFKRNKFISLKEGAGLSASYSHPADVKKDSDMAALPYYLHEALAGALLLFKEQKYGDCLNELKNVSAYTGNDINCGFYSGMCWFYKNNYKEAVKHFDFCISHPNNVFLPEAEYYKALSLYKSGQINEAFVLFEKIVLEDGFYSGKAKGFLEAR